MRQFYNLRAAHVCQQGTRLAVNVHAAQGMAGGVVREHPVPTRAEVGDSESIDKIFRELVHAIAYYLSPRQPDGIILEMNEKAASGYEQEGGLKLIGSNLLDCHPAKARKKVEEMLITREANIYTIEKKGIKKFVYQSPWYKDGQYAGIVELVLEIPFEMPHFVRS